MKNKYNILVVEDDTSARKIIDLELKAQGYSPHCFNNGEEALLFFEKHDIDLALLDFSLPGMNGEALFQKIREQNPMIPVIFMTALNSVKKAVELIKMGAYSYLTKPLDIQELHRTIDKALGKPIKPVEKHSSSEMQSESSLLEDYIFKSTEMQKLLHLVQRVAKSKSNILVTGESGTGKDIIAQIIHEFSQRKDNILVKVNLSALPPSLIEAELFGALKGSYTGAVRDRQGKFQEAHKGTLFLDEIGELSLDIQVKLLRVIQDREITHLGSNQPVKVDIRLITATNKDLEEAVATRTFREDLFYRLNVINIHVPPLRERKDEIPFMIDLFIKKFNRKEGKQVAGMSSEALDNLLDYHFPGNIRELENIIERALVLAESDIIKAQELPLFVISKEKRLQDNMQVDSSLPLPQRMTIIEKGILEAALKRHNFHQTNTARELGISEGCLRYKIRTLDIRKDKNRENHLE